MADIISVLSAAPVTPPVAGLVAPPVAGFATLLDGALAIPATPVADPFAAFLATAQALPVASVQPAAIVGATKFQPVIVAEDDAPRMDVAVEPVDEETPEAGTANPAQPAIVVDPALTPALAMLSALVTVQAGTPRPAAIAMKTMTTAPIKAPPSAIAAKPAINVARPAAIVAKPTTDVASPTLALAALSLSTVPIVAELPTTTTITAASVDTPVARQMIVSEDQATIVPATSPTPAPAAPATWAPARPAIERAVAAVIGAPVPTVSVTPVETTVRRDVETAIFTAKAKPIENTKPAHTDVPEETAAAEEVAAQAEPGTAPPIKPRAVEPRIVQDKPADAGATPDRAERARPVTPAAGAPVKIARDPVRVDPVVAPPVAVVSDPGGAAPVAQTPPADLLVQRQLVIADDGRWLDSLAHDIARSASGETIRFRLEPVNLGSLTVAIAQGSDGAAVRLTAETHRARDLLIDAQPALMAEARANGLRISETHVDLGGGNRDNNGGNNSGNLAAGNQPSFGSNSAGQQAMRQDGNARREPNPPTPSPTPSSQPRPTAARASARDDGERFA